MLQLINSKLPELHAKDKIIAYYYSFTYNPPAISCALTEELIREISITKNFWKLPDPKTCLVWIDFFEDDEPISIKSESMSSISDVSDEK